MIMRASSQRINAINKNYAETGYKPMTKFMVMLNQRFIDQKQMIRVFGKPLIIQPDDIYGNLDVIIETDVGLEKRQQEIVALTQYLREVFPFAFQMGMVSREHFIKAAKKALELSGLSIAGELFNTPEMMAQQAQMAQVAQMMQGGQMQGGQMQGEVNPLAGELQQTANGGNPEVGGFRQ